MTLDRCVCPDTGHTDECVAARVTAERAAQGLPPTVTDPTARARVASIVASTRKRAKEDVA